MRMLHIAIAAFLVAASATVATAQDRAVPANQGQAAASSVCPGQAAADKAAAEQKYIFLFFWKENNPKMIAARTTLEAAVAKMGKSAEKASIQITDPAEKKIVDKYNVSRAPMPLVLAVAPCGAITKAFTGALSEKELRAAFVSPCTELCLKALQSRKLVLVCVVDQANVQDPVTIPKGVEEFKNDAKYGSATEIILVNGRDQGEESFLRDFQVDSRAKKPVVVFLAPPGSLIGKFEATTTKQQLVAKLVSAQSNPCAGGKCGPGGCGPKK
jgi:hypothetical protein